MQQSSFRLSVSHVLPLPGVGELEGAISGLRDTLKASGYAHKEYESLVAHLESLLDAVRLAGQFEDFAQLSSELTNIRFRLEAEFKRKSHMGVVKSQARFELLCNIDREVARIVTRSQFKLLAQLRVAQQRNSMVENIPTVPSHELELRGELSSISSSLERLTWGSHYAGGSGSEGVIINRRAGYYGKLPVVYQAYSSKSNNTAAEQAEMDLNTLSKLAHANIPSLVAVTKGCYGINGIVMQIDAKIALPPHEFLSGSMPGVSLVRYIRGVHSVFEFLIAHNQKHESLPTVENVITDSNGHVTVLPFIGGNNRPGYPLSPFDLLGRHQIMDPGPRLILDRQFEHNFTEYMHGGPRSAEARDFLDKISTLPPGFSELQVLKLAAKVVLFPPLFRRYIRLPTLSNFVISPGDIGSLAGPQNYSWEGLLIGGEFDVKAIECYPDAGLSGPCNVSCRWKCCPSTSSEYNTWVIHCGHDLREIGLDMSCSNPGWGDIMQSAKEVSEKHSVELNTLSYCSRVRIFVRFAGNGMQHQPIYFHRNQFCRSDPRTFWGFFSASSDPRSPSTGLEALDDGILYRLEVDLYNICDDWRIKYEAALEKGLENMPGGYLGACVEEVSDKIVE